LKLERETMNRRELLGAAIGGATVAIAVNSALADEHAEHMEHMDHAAHMGAVSLAEVARKCAAAGDACISHCLALFVAGDNSVAACAKSVYQMNAMCEALARLASANSPHLAAHAKVCRDVCLDCEKECRKHEKEHVECKACAESCAACAEECKKHFT
jgi:Cys-rich four helix bundle protein (predicted Tat secretion target)